MWSYDHKREDETMTMTSHMNSDEIEALVLTLNTKRGDASLACHLEEIEESLVVVEREVEEGLATLRERECTRREGAKGHPGVIALIDSRNQADLTLMAERMRERTALETQRTTIANLQLCNHCHCPLQMPTVCANGPCQSLCLACSVEKGCPLSLFCVPIIVYYVRGVCYHVHNAAMHLSELTALLQRTTLHQKRDVKVVITGLEHSLKGDDELRNYGIVSGTSLLLVPSCVSV
jgi:hypothetical protein